jgi:hypothetical protein
MPVATPPRQQPPEPVRDAPGTSSALGVLALTLGIVSLLTSVVFGGFYLGVPAIVLGVLGVRQVAAGRAGGRGKALTGISLGAIALLVSTLLVGGLFMFMYSPAGKCAIAAGDDPQKVRQCVGAR